MKGSSSSKKLPYRTRKKINGLIFASPFIIGFIAFFLMPLVNTIFYSFNKIGVGETGGMTFEWVGIQNYIDLFATEVTTNSQPMARLFTEENTNMLISVPLIVIFSLFMALLANQKFKGRALVRLIFFLPIILGIDVVVEMLTMTTGIAGYGQQPAERELYHRVFNAGAECAKTDFVSDHELCGKYI